MPITATELETAAAAFFTSLLGYLVSVGFVFSNVNLTGGAEVGAVAALATLGYHVVAGNVATPAPPAAPHP
ncbi:MAG: hypothetical protein L3K18_09695 [Thermoplasmata archaeon]|nr:hypothetical protein [Thermoplasmata archaeon]